MWKTASLFNEDGSPRTGRDLLVRPICPPVVRLSGKRSVYLTMPAYKRDGKCGTTSWTSPGLVTPEISLSMWSLNSSPAERSSALRILNYDFGTGKLVVPKTEFRRGPG